MKAAEIRARFLEFFRERGHEVRPSSSLVPADDPTLLFTNAGMVQFKRAFLGEERVPFTRAATSQKCVRAGGKHNDLEEVGRTRRHLTFFEMLGNFSFGDYFKREAIRYAWDLLTESYGLDPDRISATVHHTDAEAAELWTSEAGLPAERVFERGDADNFWQMADTGPCGPCSELHYDLRDDPSGVLTSEEYDALNEAEQIVEIWNLVFMQYDRDAEGVLHPLPAPGVDTGAGLERISAVLQGVDSVFHIDHFRPLLDRVGEVVGRPYEPDLEGAVGYRVLADHARAVAFLLSDRVFPSNEGRGYVLRRILRRGVRHAWLLGRREPTVVDVVDAVVEEMGEAYPDLREQRAHLLDTTRAEEERFLATIEGGMDRFDELARAAAGSGDVIDGEDAFRLHDTFGFPLDLTELMAEEHGVRVDVEGFDAALTRQRRRSQEARKSSGVGLADGALADGWSELADGEQRFVGYDQLIAETAVLAVRRDGGRTGLILRDNPFYLESGGQVSDTGTVRGEGFTLEVSGVALVGDRTAVLGELSGELPEESGAPLDVTAEVEAPSRHDTLRNHTATHLLHAALRSVLGDHVAQRGSLVAPDRLRFDFAHTAPMTPEERERVEGLVNEAIFRDHPVQIDHRPYEAAVEAGAMALFGEKYADEVRVVSIPGVSMELCGGTHARHTGEIGLFRLVSEGGVAAGVRRVEAMTGPGALAYLRSKERDLEAVAEILRTGADNVQRRAEQLLEENATLEGLLAELRASGGAGETAVTDVELDIGDGASGRYRGIRLRARGADDARSWGDAFLAAGGAAAAVLGAEMPEEKRALFAFVTDELIGRGVHADALVREVASVVGGRGGGRPHMAQAGVEDADRLDEALRSGADVVRRLLSGDGA